LDKGKRIALVNGVDHLIEFVEADFLRYQPTTKFDIALLIGVLCPLPTDRSVTYLKLVKRFLKEDGSLIASTASKKMLSEDPFTCFLMELLANWKLFHKDEEELRAIYEEAGYIWKGCFSDTYGFHIMGIGAPFQT
jgi:SAM-dependent methyltransferase